MKTPSVRPSRSGQGRGKGLGLGKIGKVVKLQGRGAGKLGRGSGKLRQATAKTNIAKTARTTSVSTSAKAQGNVAQTRRTSVRSVGIRNSNPMRSRVQNLDDVRRVQKRTGMNSIDVMYSRG